MEVFSYSRGGESVGEAEEWYRVCQRNDYNLIPMVSHRLASPRDLGSVTGFRVHVIATALQEVPGETRRLDLTR